MCVSRFSDSQRRQSVAESFDQPQIQACPKDLRQINLEWSVSLFDVCKQRNAHLALLPAWEKRDELGQQQSYTSGRVHYFQGSCAWLGKPKFRKCWSPKESAAIKSVTSQSPLQSSECRYGLISSVSLSGNTKALIFFWLGCSHLWIALRWPIPTQPKWYLESFIGPSCLNLDWWTDTTHWRLKFLLVVLSERQHPRTPNTRHCYAITAWYLGGNGKENCSVK